MSYEIMADPDLDRFTSRRSTVYAPNGVVATSQPLAAETGIDVLKSGGNAFDAAVATAATLNVVEPTYTGIGGDVFALYRTAGGDVGAMRACGGAPAEATIERVRDAVDENPEEATMPMTGPLTVTVPGTARGWEATVERFGALTFEELLQPAIEYATEGFPVTEVIAEAWKQGESLFSDPYAREIFLVDGDRAPRVGETVRFPDLGRSLELIASRGSEVVYEGEIGEAIVDEVRSKGGFLSMSDLEAFDVEYPEPVSTRYHGAEVYELPPNNQGLIALEALNIAAEIGAGEEFPGSIDRVHKFIEAMKLAFQDGHHYVTDPDYEDIPPLASAEWARKRAAEIGPSANTDISIGPSDANAENADTVLLCVADAEGNVVSYINSRFKGFGSGLVAEGTGIALQNRGGSFSLDPTHPNRLEPGKRPFHTLIPGVVRFDDDDWAAFGVMGGYMQPQGHVQILSHLLDDNLSLQHALDKPRWCYQENGELAVEGRFDGNLATKLVRRGHDVRIRPPSDFGGAQIARNAAGTLSAATEPRKDGNATGY